LDPVYLPASNKRKVLVFDIDETMVHTLDARDNASMQGAI
jgi:predicted secreted acid phosphatase